MHISLLLQKKCCKENVVLISPRCSNHWVSIGVRNGKRFQRTLPEGRKAGCVPATITGRVSQQAVPLFVLNEVDILVSSLGKVMN